MAEAWDWTRTQDEPCPHCGFDAASVPPEALPDAIRTEASAWSEWLAAAAGAAVLHRPRPDVWSALEYACHIRDVLAIFDERIRRTLIEDDPELGWWDHEAAAADEQYNRQDPAAVARAIERNGQALAETLAGVDASAWDRAAIRRAGERFTIAGMGRFALHEAHHHRVDAAESEHDAHV